MKYVEGKVRGKTILEKVTQERIQKGTLPDFSLTHAFDLYQDTITGEYYQTKTPIEISAVREGRRAKCQIIKKWKDSPATKRKTADVYNTPNKRIMSDSQNPFLKKSVTVSASMTTPATPMETVQSPTVPATTPVPASIPSYDNIGKDEILQQALKVQEEKLSYERQFKEQQAVAAKLQAERDEMQKKYEDMQNHQRNVVISDLDAVIDVAVKLMGQEKTPEVVAALEPLRGCKDVAALQSVHKVLSGMVMAGKNVMDDRDRLQKENERIQKQNMVNQLYGQGKFSTPESRLSFDVRIPQTQPMQSQPTPMQTQQTQPMQTQPTPMQTQQTPAPQIPQQAPAQQIPQSLPVDYGRMSFNPFLQQQTPTVTVSASAQSTVPSYPVQPQAQSQPQQAFDFTQMPAYQMKSSFSGNPTADYGAIHRAVRPAQQSGSHGFSH